MTFSQPWARPCSCRLHRRGIEKVFGWIKQWGGLRQFKLRGTEKVSAVFGLHVIA